MSNARKHFSWHAARAEEVRSVLETIPLMREVMRRRTFLITAAAATAAVGGCRGCRPARQKPAAAVDDAPPPVAPAAQAWAQPNGEASEKDGIPSNIAAQCPYCGVGCGTLIQTSKGRITGVKPDPKHPVNRGLQCIKGLSAAEPLTIDRLTKPLVRKDLSDPLAAKSSKSKGRFDASLFREVSWNEAQKLVAERVVAVREARGPEAIGMYGSGQLPLETLWLCNLLMKGIIGSNCIEANARMCNTATIAGLRATLGVGSSPTCYDDIELSDMIVHWGHNPRSAHPIFFWRVADSKAERKIPTLVVDPRRTGSVRALEDVAGSENTHLSTINGDIALANAIAHVLIVEHPDAIDRDALARSCSGWEKYIEGCKARYAPEQVAAITGVAPKLIRRAAAAWAWASTAGRERGKGGVLCTWSAGLNQHLHGERNVVSLVNLLALTGNIGRPGCGPLVMSGQPNALGVYFCGALSDALPFGASLSDAEQRDRIADVWRVPRAHLAATAGRANPGYIVGMLERAASGTPGLLFLLGASCVDLPDQKGLVEPALKRSFNVVHEIFRHAPNNRFADVILPAATWGEWVGGTVIQSERRIYLSSGSGNPVFGARPDLDILIDVGRQIAEALKIDAKATLPYKRMANGFYDPQQVFADIVAASRGTQMDIGGLLMLQKGDGTAPYQRLRSGGVQWPAATYADAKGGGRARLLLGGGLPATADGKIHFDLCEQQYDKDADRDVSAALAKTAVSLTDEQRAQLLASRARGLPAEWPDQEHRGKRCEQVPAGSYPYWLGLGVVYEHYHAAKTIRAATTRKLLSEQYVELHADDGKALGVADGELVRVTTRRGSFEARAAVGVNTTVRPGRNSVPPGYLFSPWPLSGFDDRWSVNKTAHRAFDPVSGQVPFKTLAARIDKAATSESKGGT